MIRTSKHNISNITNQVSLDFLDDTFDVYKKDLITCIDYIIDGVYPLKKRMSSKDLITENIKHSKYKRDIYIKASEIIRSQIKKSENKRYNKYKYIYSYMIKNHPDSSFAKTKFKDLNLKDIINTKYFTKPTISNISINLTNEFFNIETGYHFDNFVKIILPFFNDKGTRGLQIKVPLNYHRYSNKLKSKGFNLRNNIQIKKVNGDYYINLIWEKSVNIINNGTKTLGIDLGYKKLITTSEGNIIGDDMFNLYDNISKKKQGSKNFKQLLTHRDNLINFHVNNMDLTNVKTLIIEDLNNVKHKSKGKVYKKFTNKLQRWSYVKTISKFERICM